MRHKAQSQLDMGLQSDSAEDAWELVDFLLDELGSEQLVNEIFMTMETGAAEKLLKKVLQRNGLPEPRLWVG